MHRHSYLRFAFGMLIGTFLGISCQPMAAQAMEITSLEAYGDSLTAGMLAEYGLTSMKSVSKLGPILRDLTWYQRTRQMKYLTPYEARAKAWPQFLAVKLHNEVGHAIPVYNLSVSGATTWLLVDEVTSIAPSSHAAAFFFIGHNDLYDDPQPVAEMTKRFIKSYTDALAAWDARHEQSTAYLIPIGDIPRAYETLSGFVWYRTPKHNFRCDDSWSNYFVYGRRYYLLARKNQLRRYLDPMIDAMNSGLERLAEDWDKRNYHRNHYRFLKETQQLVYKPAYFAVDCFHLSILGERALAEKIYQELGQDLGH